MGKQAFPSNVRSVSRSRRSELILIQILAQEDPLGGLLLKSTV